MFLQVAKLDQRLQSLKGQFNLPSPPVELHDGTRGVLSAQCREDEHVTRGLKCFGSNLSAASLALTPGALACLFCGDFTLLDTAQPAGKELLVVLDLYRPIGAVSGLQFTQEGECGNAVTCAVVKRECDEIAADNDIAAFTSHIRNAARMRVTPVANEDVARTDGKALKRFAVLGSGRCHLVAMQAGQFN